MGSKDKLKPRHEGNDKMVQRKIKILIATYSFPTKHNSTAGVFILNQLKELRQYCGIKVLSPYAYVPKLKAFDRYYRFSEIGGKETVDGFHVYHPKYFMLPRISLVKKFMSQFLVAEGEMPKELHRKIKEYYLESNKKLDKEYHLNLPDEYLKID